MIYNKTKNKKIVSEIVLFKSVLSKMWGLRFKKRSSCLNKGYVFLINKHFRFVVDMCFVKFPIDLIFLDASDRVIEIKRNLKSKETYVLKNKNAIKMIEVLPEHSENICLNDLLIINTS